MKILVQNVSGSCNDCFFNAVVGAVGLDIIRQLLNKDENEPVYRTDFRNYLGMMYKANDQARAYYNNIITDFSDLLENSEDISTVANLLSIDYFIAECIINNKMNLDALMECVSREIARESMVSHIDVKLILNTINNKLKEYKNITVIPVIINPSDLNNPDSIKLIVLNAFMNGKFNRDDTKYAFLLTSNIHYRYLEYSLNDNDNLSTLWSRNDIEIFIDNYFDNPDSIDASSNDEPYVMLEVEN